jgi:hypothetical protein
VTDAPLGTEEKKKSGNLFASWLLGAERGHYHGIQGKSLTCHEEVAGWSWSQTLGGFVGRSGQQL